MKTYKEGYLDGSRDKEGVIRELGDANERLRAVLRVIADGLSHDPQLDALRVLEQARKK